MQIDIDSLALELLAVCEERKFDRSWQEAGVYLHLESSEFIEALRGKGSSSPAEEAGDVIFVLFSMLAANGIQPSEAIRLLREKIENLPTVGI